MRWGGGHLFHWLSIYLGSGLTDSLRPERQEREEKREGAEEEAGRSREAAPTVWRGKDQWISWDSNGCHVMKTYLSHLADTLTNTAVQGQEGRERGWKGASWRQSPWVRLLRPGTYSERAAGEKQPWPERRGGQQLQLAKSRAVQLPCHLQASFLSSLEVGREGGSGGAPSPKSKRPEWNGRIPHLSLTSSAETGASCTGGKRGEDLNHVAG